LTENSTSLAKTKANRRNAKKSTGPKDTSLTRLNAMKHGILSKELVLDGESKKELERLGKSMRLELVPEGEMELLLVDRIITSTWRLRRAIQIERAFLQSEYNNSSFDSYNEIPRSRDKTWNHIVSRELGNDTAWLNLLRYETAIEKQIYKALHELMRVQSAKRGGKPLVPIAIDVEVSGQT